MTPLTSKSLDGNLETLILALLENSDSYGYALNLALTEGSGGSIQLKEGTLYPLLHRMEKHGWLISSWRKQPKQRRRKYYSISEEGKNLLAQQRNEWDQLKVVYQTLVESGRKTTRALGEKQTKNSEKEKAETQPGAVSSDEQLPTWLL